MPNHVRNIVKMEGVTNLPLFTDTEEYGVRQFDFNKIVPMPKTLDVQEGSSTDTSIVYYLTKRCTIPIECLEDEMKKLLGKLVSNMFVSGDKYVNDIFSRAHINSHNLNEKERDKFFENGRTYVENYKKYGHTTWYGWSREFWGTKWNSYSNEQEDEDTIIFETAWSNPEPIMLKLSKMYPDEMIEHWWADEDMGSNDGYRAYQNGTIIDGDYHESCSSDAYETYVKCWGESECLYKDEDEHWIRRECESCTGCI